MTARKTLRIDPRTLPAYSISEVAHYLNVPAGTIRYWATGQGAHLPLIDVPDDAPTLLSFINLVELHVLAAIRRKQPVLVPKVRAAIDHLRTNTRRAADQRHPLTSRQLETDGLDLFIERYGQLVNISQAGQTCMRKVMSAALHRIERDPHGFPVKLYPFTRSHIEDAPAMIVIDPMLGAGRPLIADTGLATEVIAERYKAGESVSDLAKDYERKQAEIEEAIRCELQPAA